MNPHPRRPRFLTWFTFILPTLLLALIGWPLALVYAGGLFVGMVHIGIVQTAAGMAPPSHQEDQ